MTENEGNVLAVVVLVVWAVLMIFMKPLSGSGSFAESAKRTIAIILSLAAAVVIAVIIAVTHGHV